MHVADSRVSVASLQQGKTDIGAARFGVFTFPPPENTAENLHLDSGFVEDPGELPTVDPL